MLSKSSIPSPLEKWFGIAPQDIFYDKGLNTSDSISGNGFNTYNWGKEVLPESARNSKDISRAKEDSYISGRNTEHTVSREQTLSTTPPPPPPPPPPLSALVAGKPGKNFPKEADYCSESTLPLSCSSSVAVEQLEKKLDLIHGMMLQLIDSISQKKDGQQLLTSTTFFNSSFHSEVKKKTKEFKDSLSCVELFNVREKMMEELKIRLKQMGDPDRRTSGSSS
ncbi:hypothetical protein GpartN1_g1229.t1 [Galdieria partita]|uniref:Uncharacterized protein n=1 Tax=Galdieria partita TaxID=83374 RepID=A0A9C7PRL7_9RHOD|nr:hypothetical protein GpartN1_g1229.t1 [Galdieria partita]